MPGGGGGPGGSGGAAGAGGVDGGGTLQLVQTTPADIASDVPTDIVITSEFDSALNEATVTTSSFSVRRDGDAEVGGTVTVSATTATFMPARVLGLLSTYTATLTTAIESVSGQTLDMNQAWTFRTRDGQWGDPLLIEINNAGRAREPQVALDPNGNAVAVWAQSDGTRDNIWANRFTPDAGWSLAELIETDNAGAAQNPQVALDPNGNAVAVWSQSDGTRNNVWANRYTRAAGWSVAELIETDNDQGAIGPQVALDSNGNAIAVWTLSGSGMNESIWANRFTPAAGWGVAERIDTGDLGTASRAHVAADPDGNAVALWYQWDGARNNVWANRYTPSGGWGVAELIESDNAGAAQNPQVALDPNGNAVAVWSQSDGTRDNIWANRFTPDAGWGLAELIETDNAGRGVGAKVSLDPNGNAVAVWYQSDGTRDNIWANRFTPDAGWGVAELIETDDAGGAFVPQVALDPNGNAVAVWFQSDGTRTNIWANRFD
jgi:hypothetical protein